MKRGQEEKEKKRQDDKQAFYSLFNIQRERQTMVIISIPMINFKSGTDFGLTH